mgnify:FL=1
MTPHPEVERIATYIQRLHHGKCAARILDAGLPMEESFNILTLPVFVWKPAKINVGRKEKAPDGSTFTMPIRVIHTDDDMSVSLLPADPVDTSVTVQEKGLGWDNTATVDVTALSIPPQWGCDENGSLARAVAQTVTYQECTRILTDIVTDGMTARYDFMRYLDPWLEKELIRARSYLSHDIFNGSAFEGSMVVDYIQLETLHTEMMLGTEDKPHGHMFDRLIDQCLKPSAYEGKEPLRHVRQMLHYEALYKLRTAIGDPKIGSKIRKVARSINANGVDEVVDEYRRRFPSDGLSTKRAKAALSISPRTTISTSTDSTWWHTAH